GQTRLQAEGLAARGLRLGPLALPLEDRAEADTGQGVSRLEAECRAEFGLRLALTALLEENPSQVEAGPDGNRVEAEGRAEFGLRFGPQALSVQGVAQADANRRAFWECGQGRPIEAGRFAKPWWLQLQVIKGTQLKVDPEVTRVSSLRLPQELDRQ